MTPLKQLEGMMSKMNGVDPMERYVNDTDKCIVQEEWNLPYMPVKNTIPVEESKSVDMTCSNIC
jgi:hypothetical protein